MLDRLTIERMAAKAGEGPILIALSGGGDSVALLRLMAQEFGAGRLRAIVVDHALRDGSRVDAERAVGFARAAGVAAEIATLSWPADANRAHEAAREARYAVLCDAARVHGARVIATGHTRDDQAETVVLRIERSSGLRGLAGIAPFTRPPLWPEGRGLWIGRPLLGVRRETLRDYLRSIAAEWIEDPANENAVYARVRVRRLLAERESEGADPMRFAELAEELRPAMDAVDDLAAMLIDRTATFSDAEIGIDAQRLGEGEHVRQRVLQALIIAAGAGQRGPSSEQLAELDTAISGPDFTAATLAGALIQKKRDALVLTRDRGALAGRADGAPPVAPRALAAGIEAVWDNRVALTASEPGWSVVFENGAPVLARGEERAALAHAAPHWLLKTRVQHVLGRD